MSPFDTVSKAGINAGLDRCFDVLRTGTCTPYLKCYQHPNAPCSLNLCLLRNRNGIIHCFFFLWQNGHIRKSVENVITCSSDYGYFLILAFRSTWLQMARLWGFGYHNGRNCLWLPPAVQGNVSFTTPTPYSVLWENDVILLVSKWSHWFQVGQASQLVLTLPLVYVRNVDTSHGNAEAKNGKQTKLVFSSGS